MFSPGSVSDAALTSGSLSGALYVLKVTLRNFTNHHNKSFKFILMGFFDTRKLTLFMSSRITSM